MPDQDIQEISEITTEKGVLGTRYVVEVDGKKKKFRELEERCRLPNGAARVARATAGHARG